MTNKLLTQFKNARKFGVPLLGVETPDMAATITEMIGALNGKGEKVPLFKWDIVVGLQVLNEAAKKDIGNMGLQKDQLSAMTINPTEMLSLLQKVGSDACIFLMNAHRFWDNEGVVQAVWNLRDPFKATGRTLVLLAPAITLPVELERDVLVLDEPLPTDEQLGAIADAVYQSAGFTKPLSGADRISVIKAARGLAAFAAEQAIALSLEKSGINIEELWERKRSMIEQTKGLQVYNGGESFSEIGGIARVKEFGSRLFAGNEPPSAVIFVDEIEKALAGAGGSGSGGDSSGVSQDALGVLLSAMQDNEWSGMILLGPPGCAKSLYAKALGATHNVPCIKLDLGAMKGSLVGQSEQQVRGAVKVINAVAGKGAYWVVTCNKLDSLPPELRRRFTDGVWMFDLPTPEERQAIWAMHTGKFKLGGSELPEDTNWTGADIRNVCSIAYRLKVSLKEAASYITPVAVSDPTSIDRLRKLADGSFLSASHAGVFRMNESAVATKPVAGRRLANAMKGD